MRRLAVLIVVLLGCGDRRAARPDASSDAPAEPPAWLVARFRDSEVEPFDKYRAPGLTLYGVRWTAMHTGSYSVVGVDASRRMVRGKALFLRMARERLSAFELARRAMGTVVGVSDRGDVTPLDRERCALFVAPKSRCAIVTPPRVEGGVLVFYSTRHRNMDDDALENRVTLATGEVTSITDLDLRLQRGETVEVGESRCEAFTRCGAWEGCISVTPVIVSEGPTRWLLRRDDAPRDAPLLEKNERCENRVCFEACEDETCRPAVSTRDEICTRTHRPSRAPFHCVAHDEGERVTCETVAH